jgi:hypothetical protein
MSPDLQRVNDRAVHPSRRGVGDSGEAELTFRRETERHSGMNLNTIGADKRGRYQIPATMGNGGIGGMVLC